MSKSREIKSFVFLLKEHRLVEFFFKELVIAKYKELSYLVRIILTLSHGQAAVERGFNHSNYVLQPNMTPNTIISKQLIKDHMLARWLEPRTIEITIPMIKFFRAARELHDSHLKEEKKLKEKNDAERRTQLIAAGIEKLKTKQKYLTKAIELMETEYFQCKELAEKEDDMSFVLERNGIKRKSVESKKEI